MPIELNELIAGIIASGIGGLGLNQLSFYFTRNRDLLKTIIKIMDSVGNSYFSTKSPQITWSSKKFKTIVQKYIEEHSSIPLMEDLGFVFSEYLGPDVYKEIESNFLEEYRFQCLCEIGKDAGLTNLMLLSSIAKENGREKELRNGLFASILKDIKSNRQSDLYNNLSFLNTAVYPYMCNILNENCTDEMIDLAYFLTDVYDYTSEYERAINLSEQIKGILMNKPKSSLTVHELRQMIGCVYSSVIAKIDDESEKIKMIKQAEEDFGIIKDIIDGWNWYENTDKWFIYSLYDSDYGALLINKAFVSDEKSKSRYLEEALKYHEQAAELRQRIIRIGYLPEEVSQKEDIERYYYKSKSNIAYVYYLMGNYNEAIKRHKEVLQHQLESKETINIYITKAYIAGCLLLKRDKEYLTSDEMTECQSFIKECEGYYDEKNDAIRLKDIRKMKERLFL